MELPSNATTARSLSAWWYWVRSSCRSVSEYSPQVHCGSGAECGALRQPAMQNPFAQSSPTKLTGSRKPSTDTRNVRNGDDVDEAVLAGWLPVHRDQHELFEAGPVALGVN